MKNEIKLYTTLILTSVVPLIVFGYQIIPVEGSIRYLTSVTYEGGKQIDFFNYYKEILLGVGGMVLILCESSLKGFWKKLGYLLLFLSGINYFLSYSKATALMGINGRYEGFVAQIGCIAIFICGINLFNKEESKRSLIKGLIISSNIIFIVGFFQFFGYDIFSSEVGRKIITGFQPENYGELIYSFVSNSLYGTFGNPNYMGSYGVMMFYLGLGKYLTSERNYIYGGYTLLAYANLVGSHSRAGKVGLYFGGLILVFILGRELKDYWKRMTVMGILMSGIWYGMNAWSDNYLDTRTELGTGKISTIYAINPVNGGVLIEGKNNLTIKKDGKDLIFLDGSERRLETLRRNGRVYLSGDGYEGYFFQRNGENTNHYLLNHGELKYELLWTDEGVYTRDYNGGFVPIESVERFKPLDGYENKGSKRGYIWSRSIPLLLKRPLTGWGQDNFVLAFPQTDFFGKRLFFDTPGMLVDKPHNYFLQIGINNGLIYLGLTLFMFGYYFFKGIIWELLKTKDIYSFVFIGTIAYLITLLFNDSVVSVAPVFWCLMAMVIAQMEGEKV